MTVEQEIEHDLDWRLKELDALKRQTKSMPKNTIRQRAMLRAVWAMLYAHYEGFCKNAITIYLQELERMGLNRSEFRYELQVFSLTEQCRNIQGGTSTSDHIDFMKIALPQLESSEIRFETDKKTGDYKLKGRSNLWPHILKENCKAIGLPARHLASEHRRLGLLVDRRNKIAHGEKLVVSDLKEYEEFEAAAVGVMFAIGIEVIEAIENASYRKPQMDIGHLGRWLKVQKKDY